MDHEQMMDGERAERQRAEDEQKGRRAEGKRQETRDLKTSVKLRPQK